jgi:hypothetical protein
MTTSPKALVERFYFEVWNRADEQVAREILHPDFRFRASLGPERRGPDGFIGYIDQLTFLLKNMPEFMVNLTSEAGNAQPRTE